MLTIQVKVKIQGNADEQCLAKLLFLIRSYYSYSQSVSMHVLLLLLLANV